MSRIKITKPTKAELDKLGINKWSKWECEPSTFDWTYDDKETAYVFEGKVKVKSGNEEVEINGGDLVEFPKGMKCTWTVIKKIRKVYKFG